MNSELVHIAVTPPPSVDANLATKAAPILGREPFETRLLLAGRIPKVIAHASDLQKAETITRSLSKAGIEAYPVTESEIQRPVDCFQVHTLENTESEMFFKDAAGNEKRVTFDNIFLILTGTVQETIETTNTKQKRKLNLPLTLMLGGIPISRKVKEETTSRSARCETFIRLYEREPAESVIEILQSRMNYSFLKSEMAMSSNINFSKTVSILRKLCPQAIFDDRLMKSAAAIIYTGRAQDDLEINCKLITLFYRMQLKGTVI